MLLIRTSKFMAAELGPGVTRMESFLASQAIPSGEQLTALGANAP